MFSTSRSWAAEEADGSELQPSTIESLSIVTLGTSFFHIHGYLVMRSRRLFLLVHRPLQESIVEWTRSPSCFESVAIVPRSSATHFRAGATVGILQSCSPSPPTCPCRTNSRSSIGFRTTTGFQETAFLSSTSSLPTRFVDLNRV